MDPQFQSGVEDKIVYDQDLKNKPVLHFTLAPSLQEHWVLTTVTIANDAANFDVNNTGEGVTAVKLWVSNNSTFEESSDTLLSVIPNATATFNSQAQVTVALNPNGGPNTIDKNTP